MPKKPAGRPPFVIPSLRLTAVEARVQYQKYEAHEGIPFAMNQDGRGLTTLLNPSGNTFARIYLIPSAVKNFWWFSYEDARRAFTFPGPAAHTTFMGLFESWGLFDGRPRWARLEERSSIAMPKDWGLPRAYTIHSNPLYIFVVHDTADGTPGARYKKQQNVASVRAQSKGLLGVCRPSLLAAKPFVDAKVDMVEGEATPLNNTLLQAIAQASDKYINERFFEPVNGARFCPDIMAYGVAGGAKYTEEITP